MTTTAISKSAEYLIEQVILKGDLAEPSPADRVTYYGKVCESIGLNPLTRPFEYIKLNNKLTLYCRKDATDQLRQLHNISVDIPKRETIDGVYIVTAHASMNTRCDESTGAVDISNLKGEFRANAMMKAETKAKRRVTLSIVGPGWLDESEVADIPKHEKQVIDVNPVTGEIAAPSDDPPSMPIAQEQINKLSKVDQQELRAKVKSYGYPAKSIKELTFDQAARLITELV